MKWDFILLSKYVQCPIYKANLGGKGMKNLFMELSWFIKWHSSNGKVLLQSNNSGLLLFCFCFFKATKHLTSDYCMSYCFIMMIFSCFYILLGSWIWDWWTYKFIYLNVFIIHANYTQLGKEDASQWVFLKGTERTIKFLYVRSLKCTPCW